MLVIRAEIWPQGVVAERFEIARLGIINRGGNRNIADYNVIGLLGLDRQEWVTQGIVLAHARHIGWQPLVARALTEQQDACLHEKYVQRVAELLKRG